MTLRNAELLAIGSELLGPWHLDTNGAYLALRLGEIGIAVRFRVVVGDDPADLQAAFRIALSRSDLVIATGGLGPTVDDRTRETYLRRHSPRRYRSPREPGRCATALLLPPPDGAARRLAPS